MAVAAAGKNYIPRQITPLSPKPFHSSGRAPLSSSRPNRLLAEIAARAD
jgi:hypothetical protein